MIELQFNSYLTAAFQNRKENGRGRLNPFHVVF